MNHRKIKSKTNTSKEKDNENKGNCQLIIKRKIFFFLNNRKMDSAKNTSRYRNIKIQWYSLSKIKIIERIRHITKTTLKDIKTTPFAF